MKKIVFDSAQMPGDDRLRKETWIDTLASAVARLNVDPAPNIDFEGRLEIVPMENGSVSSVAATFRNATRSAQDIGIDGRDTVLFMINAGHDMCRLSQRGRDIDCAPGVILNKDGSLQRTARFSGPDLDSATPSELVAVSSRINNALRRLGSGWALFVEAQRLPSRAAFPGTFVRTMAQSS